MRLVGLALVALLVAGCGGHARTGTARVTRIELAPAPQGATLVASAGSGAGRRSLAAVAGALPARWPANPPQACRLGTTITFTAGRTYVYGPCRWPASIERVRRALLAAAPAPPSKTRSAPVSSAAWKAVLNDWYDGHMDHWHPCAAVREAIRHLPADPATYSTVELDLQAYARGVCG